MASHHETLFVNPILIKSPCQDSLPPNHTPEQKKQVVSQNTDSKKRDWPFFFSLFQCPFYPVTVLGHGHVKVSRTQPAL